jgi:hypothetical protein
MAVRHPPPFQIGIRHGKPEPTPAVCQQVVVQTDSITAHPNLRETAFGLFNNNDNLFIFVARRQEIEARRGRNIAKVAAARKLLTLVYYWLRDGHIRALDRARAA